MTDQSEPLWDEPPAARVGGRTGVWMERLLPLMDEPGRSALIYVGPEGKKKAAEKVAYALRHRKVITPPGIWEFTSRWINSENVSKAWAKYVGDETDEELPGAPVILAPAVARETTEEYEKRHQALGGTPVDYETSREIEAGLG